MSPAGRRSRSAVWAWRVLSQHSCPAELAQRNAANLHTKLGEVNERKHLVRRVPSENEVSGWIEQVGTLPRAVHY